MDHNWAQAFEQPRWKLGGLQPTTDAPLFPIRSKALVARKACFGMQVTRQPKGWVRLEAHWHQAHRGRRQWSRPKAGRSLRDQIFFFAKDRLKDCPRDRQSPTLINRELPPTAHHQPPPTASHQPLPTANGDQPPTANHCQPPPTTNHQLPTAANHHQSPPTASCRPATANRQPPTATNHG